MTLNIKNLFKKICVLGASATMALGLCAPLANAAQPTDGTTGIRWNSSVVISPANGYNTLSVNLNLANNLTYNGSAQQLVTNGTVTKNGSEGTGTELWLRVVKTSDNSQQIGWTKVIDASDVKTFTGITATNSDTYDIYYYVDGKGNYTDIGTNS